MGPLSGQVFGWGFNGNGEATGTPTPDVHPSLPNGAISSRGYYEASHPCANGFVTISGTLLTDVVAVAAGNCHGLALRSDGTVVGWGLNKYGEATGTPSPGFASGQVRIDGHLLSNVVAISGGYYDSLALIRDGTIVRWGGLPLIPRVFHPERWSNVVAVAGGYDCGLVLKSDGNVGSLDSYRPNLPNEGGLTNIVAIAAPGDMNGNSLALAQDGMVIQWRGFSRQPVPAGAAKAVAIAVGTESCLALKKDGTVFAWGSIHSGEPTSLSSRGTESTLDGLVTVGGSMLTNVVAISAAGGHGNGDHSLALKHDGTVVAWGCFGWECPAFVPDDLSNVTAIAAGGGPSIDGRSAGFCLAITTNRPS